jgi:hypothetical protein
VLWKLGYTVKLFKQFGIRQNHATLREKGASSAEAPCELCETMDGMGKGRLVFT